MTNPLTENQAKTLRFLQSWKEDYCPSFREIQTAMKFSSTSTVSRILDALEERGYVKRIRNRDRAIEVIRRI